MIFFYLNNCVMKRKIPQLLLTTFLLSNAYFLQAQTQGIRRGAQAMNSLTSDLQEYIDPVTTVVYIIAAIVGLIGALRVYNNWQGGKDNVMQSAGGWLGACLFILVANTFLREMFVV